MRGLDGKVAIVTGAAGRIGKATVQRLVEEGVRVAAADVNATGVEALADRLGTHVLAIECDASDEGSIASLVARTVDRFGRLDILHNNAALTNLKDLGSDGTVLDTPLSVFDQTIKVNVRGYFAACRHAIPHMQANGGGVIVNMTSNAALGGDDARICYGVSKGAISVLTLYIASQHGKQGIRCNAISPGFIADEELKAAIPNYVNMMERHVLGPRVGQPDDIASLVAFLASAESEFIQGQIISVDGGISAHQPMLADTMAMETPFS